MTLQFKLKLILQRATIENDLFSPRKKDISVITEQMFTEYCFALYMKNMLLYKWRVPWIITSSAVFNRKLIKMKEFLQFLTIFYSFKNLENVEVDLNKLNEGKY